MGTGNHPSQTRGDGQMVQYSIESNFRQFEKTWHVYKISSLELFFIVDIKGTIKQKSQRYNGK